ncbi:hypothetical protein K6V98_00420 [Collinsella sp. AGMB00827]|uniref:SAM-dependent MTase RsmB/NOP-type domain-containing protein n=1 Tax=Collinsella ureilytica TaxID=2869515 RepID=A0ABS7MKB2_9ACTN|nr:hypothetical protein [Collinsella urealyticum]
MSGLSPARKAALAILEQASFRGVHVQDVLADTHLLSGLDSRDAAFARRLALGTVATSGCIHELLDRFLRSPKSLSRRVRIALQLAAFDLLYLGREPQVGVSQGVELVRSRARAATGLANAVLRRVAEQRKAFFSASDVAKHRRQSVMKARLAGLPTWLFDAIEASVGLEAASDLAACQLDPAPLSAYVHDVSWSGFEPVAGLAEPCCEVGGSELVGAYAISDMQALLTSDPFLAGRVIVTDLHAQRVARSALRPGSLLEIGAGRGNKTYVLASLAKRSHIAREHIAIDISAYRCRMNRDRLARAGLGESVQVYAGDACALDTVLADHDRAAGGVSAFDTVLIDAPCSGTGTMRRHPEIPWRLDQKAIAHDLPALQGRLLEAAAKRVAVGGLLIYATCSVLSSENDEVIQAFLESNAGRGWHLAWSWQTCPAPGAFDGHFAAGLVRDEI